MSTRHTAIELEDVLRVAVALNTMRRGIKGIDGMDWRRKYGARFRSALYEIKRAIQAEGRENIMITDLCRIADTDDWAAVKEAERLVERHLS